MIDEQLIAEVQQHSVIYNRQKYFLNGGGPIKYESKEAAWQIIAHKLGSDVETCKKRWKYLRERYVQQRKHCDPPTYEHLSRPYLEKMKFLDQHIQPRKSYRNVPHFLNSPNANSSYADFMDSSRSNGSVTNPNPLYPNFNESFNSTVKSEPDDSLKEYSAISKEQIHLIQQQFNYQQQQQLQSHNHPQQFTSSNQNSQIQNEIVQNNTNSLQQSRHEQEISPHLPSSSSSLKSPLSSPPTTADNMEISIENSKKPRVQPIAVNPENEDNDDNSDSDSDDYQKSTLRELLGQMNRNGTTPTAAFQNDFLLSLYQQFPQNRQLRSSEQLLGELVTTELLKMNKEKRRIVQKKILEILFFQD